MRAHWDLCPSPAAGGEGDPPVGGPLGVGGDREIPGGGGAGDKVYPGIWTAPALSLLRSTFYGFTEPKHRTGPGKQKKTNISKENFDIFSYF